MELANCKRRNMKRIKEVIQDIVFVSVILIFGVFFVTQLVSGNLNDAPIEYSIPEGAISGGTYVENGRTYERYQLGDKFYILDLENGAKIRK